MNKDHAKTEVIRINSCTVRMTYASESGQMEGLRKLMLETLRQEVQRKTSPCFENSR